MPLTADLEQIGWRKKISYQSPFLGAVFFRPLSNNGRISSNCSLVISLGYFFLMVLV